MPAKGSFGASPSETALLGLICLRAEEKKNPRWWKSIRGSWVIASSECLRSAPTMTLV